MYCISLYLLFHHFTLDHDRGNKDELQDKKLRGNGMACRGDLILIDPSMLSWMVVLASEQHFIGI